ncbi:MAG TPA: hypothetical protein VFE51_26740 [Verrucomicrobiae bacterium]|nr:hypothetical protein [Verrucomicrobiae bacterium]
MKTAVCCLALTISTSLPLPSAAAKDLKELSVLYIGSERSAQFIPFLKVHVARVEAKSRQDFQTDQAASFDVVLLDWPQTGRPEDFPPKASPLGKREAWTKPTVLLGSAGLNLAVVWKLKGGTGCTCMDPLAYDLRLHEIFERPFKIERKMVSVPTPVDFQAEIKSKEIEVLPLVDDYKQQWRAGWCSYSYDFARNPDLEFFCGGVNHKTPTAAGLWRQGNLLHFGFEQSPTEMNESGQHLLLNAIVYISRFSEDRPIAVTPSVFAGKVARSRTSFSRALRNPEYQLDWIKQDISPELWSKLVPLGREKMAEWVDHDGQFLHPGASTQLELDEDLVALGVPFDKPEFFERTLHDLRAGGAEAERAKHLLQRYVPMGPKAADPEEWSNWWRANKPYAFASDSSDYCWYIDPLAKKRGTPTTNLRGPRRADVPAKGD